MAENIIKDKERKIVELDIIIGIVVFILLLANACTDRFELW